MLSFDGQVCDMLSYAFRVVMSLIQKRDYRYSLIADQKFCSS